MYLSAALLVLASCSRQPSSSVECLEAGSICRDTILDVPCRVYLPAHYAQRAKAHEVFPVLYLQHGMYGDENDWAEKGALLAIMDSLLHRGEIQEMVVVMPDNCPHRPTSEEEKMNATNGEWEKQFAAFMAQTESKYSVSNEPAQRAIAGLSMGGYHTLRVATHLDGQFAYVGLFSPATFIHEIPTQYQVFWLGIGRDDFLYEMVHGYRHWLNEQHAEYTYYESTGGHDWPNWQDYICRFLKKLNF